MLPISNLLAEERQEKGDVLKKTDGGRKEEGARGVDWGRGTSARLSFFFFLTEDSQPSVRRQTRTAIICPTSYVM